MKGYLPYGRGAPGSWLLSGLVSFVVHGGVIAVLTAGVSQWFVDRPLPTAAPEFQITLEQLESDTLAGLVERLGEASGLDAAEEMDALDPDGELAPEDEFDEAALPDPEELDAEDPENDDDLPEPEEVEELEVEEVEELEVEELDGSTPEELETTEAEDLTAETPEETTPEAVEAEELEPETLEPEAVEAPEPEAVEEPEPEVVEAPEPEAVEEPDAVETAELDAIEAEAPEPDTVDALDVVEAEPLEDPVEAVTAEELAPEPTSPEPVELTEIAPQEDIAALVPDDEVILAPTDADPLIVEDGSVQAVVGADVIDPSAGEDALAPVVTEEVPSIGATPVDEGPEELAALVPTEPPLPGTDTPEAVEPVALPVPPDALEPEESGPEPAEIDAIEATDPAQDDDTDNSLAATPVDPPAQAPRVTRRPRAPPSERDLAIGDLIQRIRAKTVDNCVIGLPRRDGEDGIGLALLAAEDGAMGTFAEEVLVRPEDEAIRQTRTLLDERQCAALSFIAKNRDYPATRIGMRVDNAEVPSGNRVSGVMRGVGDRNLGLFLVDNNGVVQDLERFTVTSGEFVRFDIPVTRVGRLRDTKQLLIAIASTEPLDVLKDRSGERADDFFANLSNELSRNAALAIVAFDVR